MGGLENRMRVTGVTSTFGTLSIAGIPPFNGFWSKLFIILGAVAAKQCDGGVPASSSSRSSPWATSCYLQRRVFFGKLNERWKDLKEAPASMSIAVIVLAAGCLLFGRLLRLTCCAASSSPRRGWSLGGN